MVPPKTTYRSDVELKAIKDWLDRLPKAKMTLNGNDYPVPLPPCPELYEFLRKVQLAISQDGERLLRIEDGTEGGGGDDVFVNSFDVVDPNFNDEVPAPPSTLRGFTQSDDYFNGKFQYSIIAGQLFGYNVSLYVPKRQDLLLINGNLMGNYLNTATVAAADNIHPWGRGYFGGGTRGDTFVSPSLTWFRNIRAMTAVAQTNGRTMTFRAYRESEGTDVALSVYGNALAGLQSAYSEATLVGKGSTWSIAAYQSGAVGGQTIYNLVWEAATLNGTSLLGSGGSSPNTIPARIRANTAAGSGGGNNTIQLDAAASGIDSFYNGMRIYLTGGTGSGQDRVILSYVGATQIATLESDWATNPDATTTFTIAGTQYILFGTNSYLAASQEADAQIKVPFAFTIEDFSLFIKTIQTQGANGDLTLTIRKNSLDTGCRIIIPASNGSGNYDNPIGTSDSFAENDLFSACIDNQDTAVSAQISAVCAAFLQSGLVSDYSNFKQILVAGADALLTSGNTYWTKSLFSTEILLNASGEDVRKVQCPMLRNGVMRKLRVRAGRDSGTNTAIITITVMKNNVATALTVTIPGNSTAQPVEWYEDNTNSFSYVKGDLIHIEHVVTNGGDNRIDQIVLENALS